VDASGHLSDSPFAGEGFTVLTEEFRFLEHIVLAVVQLEGGCTFRPARFISPKFFVDQLQPSHFELVVAELLP